MNGRRSQIDRILLGTDRSVSVRWAKLALGLLVVAGVGFALGQVLWITAPANPTGALETLSTYVGPVLLLVALVSPLVGLLAGVVQAYLNDGFAVSLALGFAPVLGLGIGYQVSEQVLFAVAREELTGTESGLYVFIGIGALVLVLGVVGFVLGAGGRRARTALR